MTADTEQVEQPRPRARADWARCPSRGTTSGRKQDSKTSSAAMSAICWSNSARVRQLPLVTEEAFLLGGTQTLEKWVAGQPPWSDFPFIILTSRATSAATLLIACAYSKASVTFPCLNVR